MAYADGLLGEADVKALEERLAKDPALVARLEPFIVTGKPISRLFEKTLSTDIPDRLVDAIFAPPKQPSRAAGTARSGWTDITKTLRGSMLIRFGGPAFAGLAVAALSGWLIYGEVFNVIAPAGALLAATPRGTLAVGQLAASLDGQHAGPEFVKKGDEGRQLAIKVDLSFLAADGRVCRQYQVDTAGQVFGGVACKSAADGWRVEVHAPAEEAVKAATGVRTASDGAQKAPAEVSAAVDRLIASDVFTPQLEDKFIAKGWVKAP